MRQRVRYAYDGLSGVDRNEFKIDFLLGDVSIFFSIERKPPVNYILI